MQVLSLQYKAVLKIIISLLLSVLLRVCSTSNKVRVNKRMIFSSMVKVINSRTIKEFSTMLEGGYFH